MNAKRNGYVAAIAAVALAGVCVAAALLKIPPFSDDAGKIEASEVCESLGPASQSVDALRSVLPEEPSYSFTDDVNVRVDIHDDSYRSDCFVSAGGRQLLGARTQMMRDEPTQSWIDGEVAGKTDQLKPFSSDVHGVASSSVAAVFLPCTSAGNIPGGQYNLSVVIHLEEAGNAGTLETRAGLVELAKSAASFAHDKAKCDIPLS
ncbi:hypothetical protein D1J63_09570 [Streptomyces sp. KPB2]|uniref:hypothetical protein n=1 Tax=Streptomyces TaxID=1883 RepID=UPI000F6F9801|nr:MULTISPECIES: hypothetical protein [unclassified Streptomyces]AZM75185.1 hypothetical protein D1J63_09570 [Streptomyces sp. KPB2]QKW60700.1 hypothetical protein HUT15_09305 [Streptomyces sp. NA03103]